MNTESQEPRQEQKMTIKEYLRRRTNINLGTYGGIALSAVLGVGLSVHHRMQAPEKPEGYEEFASRKESVSRLERARNETQSLISLSVAEYRPRFVEALNNIDEIISLQRQTLERISYENPEVKIYERETKRHNNLLYGLGYAALMTAGMVTSRVIGNRKKRKLDEEFEK